MNPSRIPATGAGNLAAGLIPRDATPICQKWGLSSALGFFLPVLVILLFGSVAEPQTGSVSALGDSSRERILHSTHPLAKPIYELGEMNRQEWLSRMVLVLGATTENETALQQYLESQQDRNSPRYRRWMTPEEFGDKFGPSQDDVGRVNAWLRSQGFQVDAVARSRRWIEFSGTAGQVETAFQTRMSRYQIGAALHVANSTDISIPADLRPIVRGVLSLHDFFSRPMLAGHFVVERDSQGRLVPSSPAFTSTGTNGTSHYIAPGDFAAIYNLSPLHKTGMDGTGQSIAIVGRENIELFDAHFFRQIFGLPENDPNVILDGPDPGVLASDDSLEATLDVEWAGAAAPNAMIDLVVSASTTTTDGVDLSAAYIVDRNVAGVMGVSFQACEQDLGPAGNAFHNALWEQAAAQGISVLVAAGDNGAAGCDNQHDPNNVPAQRGLAVNGLASTPFNTAVGGTQFDEGSQASTYWSTTNNPDLSSAVGYIPEAVWNESCDPTVANSPCAGGTYSLWAGSGGASSIYTKPDWQSGSNVPADGWRDLPDVSLAAAAKHDGYLICFIATACSTTVDSQGNTILQSAGVAGGTSVSTPAFAGILSVIGQLTGTRLGLANYMLYRLAANENFVNCNSSTQTAPSSSSACVFYDVTVGDNSVPGLTGFSAVAGYDQATGLGSVNALNLVNAWNSVSFQPSTTTLSVGTGSLQHGQAAQVTVGVAAKSGTGIPSGGFSLVSDKYGPAGGGALANGTFSGTISSLPGGQYNLAAHYNGDGTFGGSDSAAIPVSITPESSTISLTAYTYSNGSPIPVTSAPYGNFLYLHVTVSGASGNGIATGMVTFQDGATTLGSIALNSKGEGELVSGGYSTYGAAICLPVGTHSITATYSGDNSFSTSSTNTPLSIVITKAIPSVYFGSGGSVNIITGQQLTMVGWVKGNGPTLPTGTVQFLDGSTPIGVPVSIPSGTFKAMTSASFTAGTHSISLSYSGDSVYNASVLNTFGPLTVNVTAPVGIATQTQLTAPASVTIGNPITYSVTVTSGQATKPTGTVQVLVGDCATCLNPISLQNGSGSTYQPPIATGPLIAVAQYSGDSTYAASSSAPQTIMVMKATPTISLAASASAVASGSRVSLTTTLTAPSNIAQSFPSAQVQFLDAYNGGATQPLAAPQYLTIGNGFPNEAATLLLVLPDGTHSLTAQFLGDSNMNPASSSAITVTVGLQPPPPPKDFAITATPTTESIKAGQSATYTLQISPQNGFSGTVTPTCSGAPQYSTCTVSPTSVVLDGSTTSSVSVTIATTARSASLIRKPDSRLGFMWAGGLFLVGGLLLSPRTRRRVPSAMMALVLLLSASCGGGGGNTATGGGGNGGGGGTVGTPSGTSTVTLTATSGNLSHNAVVSLTVN